MLPATPRHVLVAHRRAPVLRMIRTNLEADGLDVHTASSPPTCLETLRTRVVDALVLDADLVRGDSLESARLLRYLLATSVPTLVVSWDPADRLLARTLHDAPFINRPDDIDQVLGQVHDLLASGARA